MGGTPRLETRAPTPSRQVLRFHRPRPGGARPHPFDQPRPRIGGVLRPAGHAPGRAPPTEDWPRPWSRSGLTSSGDPQARLNPLPYRPRVSAAPRGHQTPANFFAPSGPAPRLFPLPLHSANLALPQLRPWLQLSSHMSSETQTKTGSTELA